MKPDELLAIVISFKNWAVWVIIGVVAVFGALGGWAHKLASPTEDQRRWPSFVIVGAVAALAVLFVLGPKDPIKLIALAVVSGYGGKSILDALGNKVKLALSEAETKKARDQRDQVVAVAKEAIILGQGHANKTKEGTETLEKLEARLEALKSLFQ
ncbi:MAG: hypothetical protein ABR951_12050 [Candidatus Aminicenantales bacterium]